MRASIKRLLRGQGGSVGITTAWLVFITLLFTVVLGQCAAALYQYDYALDLLQRTVNTAVENNIRDEYRADHVLKMDVAAAEASFYAYVESDITAHGRYTVQIDSVTTTETPPSMTATGSVTFPPMFSGFGVSDLTVRFEVGSTNYDLDG